MDVLAKRLKWLREKNRYSQKDIADKIGMSAGGYQKIEYGERDPKLDVLVKLASIFEVSCDFLLGVHDRTKEMENLSSRAYVINQFIKLKKLELINKNKIDNDNLNKLNEEIEDLIDSYKGYISEYIQIFYYIPECRPHDDEIILSVAPFETKTLYNEKIRQWEIDIIDNDGYELVVFILENEEEYQKEYEKLISFFEKIVPPKYILM